MQFGSVLPEEFVTVVSSRFENLSVMDVPDLDVLLSATYAEESDEESDFGNPALSPGALAAREREQQAEGDPVMADVVMGQDVTRPVNEEPVRPTGEELGLQVVTPSLPVARRQDATQDLSRGDKEDLRGIQDYLRGCKEVTHVFDGVHDASKASVQESWNDLLLAIETDCVLSDRMSNRARVMFLKHHLSGRPLADYFRIIGQWSTQKAAELLKPKPDLEKIQPLPPFQSVLDQLRRTYLAGQRQSMVDLTHHIMDVKLHQIAEKYVGI
jgi:hypothetical protein